MLPPPSPLLPPLSPTPPLAPVLSTQGVVSPARPRVRVVRTEGDQCAKWPTQALAQRRWSVAPTTRMISAHGGSVLPGTRAKNRGVITDSFSHILPWNHWGILPPPPVRSASHLFSLPPHTLPRSQLPPLLRYCVAQVSHCPAVSAQPWREKTRLHGSLSLSKSLQRLLVTCPPPHLCSLLPCSPLHPRVYACSSGLRPGVPR